MTGWEVVYTHIHTHTQCNITQSLKKKWNFDVCNNMDGLGGYYAKWNKSEKHNTTWEHLYMESKQTNKLVSITKKDQTHSW